MANLFVPAELLEKLHCSSCNCYLSIFPIHIRNDGNNPICGRCKVPNADEYLRDEAYEGIAQFIVFPCSQTKNGCNEQLTPLKLLEHENFCPNRKMDCPSKNFSKCNWQGPNKDLLSHFETSHAALILSSRKFEIQFINSIKEVVLMPYENELFIVRKEIDSRMGTFICYVEHVVQDENPESFSYFVRIDAGNGTHHHKFPEKSTSAEAEEKTKFTLEFAREKLQDPAVIIANIGIIKTGLKDDQPVANVEIRSSEVNWDQISELECPVCLEYMLPPIYQCLKGHSICQVCKPKVAECPICKGEIKNTQNFSLEKITVRLIYPCKYHKQGCAVTLKSSEIRRHESSCQYGPYECPLSEIEKCKQTFTINEIVKHVEDQHDAYILKNDRINVAFAGPNSQIEKYYLTNFATRIFKICFKYEEEKFYWTLQLIGPVEKCNEFKLEIDLIDNSNQNLRQYARGLCVPFGKHADCFKTKKNYILFHYDQISEYISDYLSYRVRVVKD